MCLGRNKKGKGYFKAKLSPNLRLDTLFIPFYSNAQAEANALTLSLFDPLSKMPSFKLCAAKIQSPTGQTTHTAIRKEKK
nr:molybdopterin dinucleotide binding domain-containing protein [Methylacidiphilum kamchatkense]